VAAREAMHQAQLLVQDPRRVPYLRRAPLQPGPVLVEQRRSRRLSAVRLPLLALQAASHRLAIQSQIPGNRGYVLARAVPAADHLPLLLANHVDLRAPVRSGHGTGPASQLPPFLFHLSLLREIDGWG